MDKRLNKLGLFAIILSTLLFACGEAPVPKPRGFIRHNFPSKSYKSFKGDCAYSMDIPSYSLLKKTENPCNFILWFPKYKAEVFLSYQEIDEKYSLQLLLDEMHGLTYQHQVKASAINAKTRTIPAENKLVLEYELEGNVASPYQFCVTDSVQHFLRGALYFRAKPNQDSTKPVEQYIRQDIDRLINSLEWKD